jgi:DNA-binding transcriptional ArsR family regulator/NAD-dependent dihydropyrimidine dehydrogenase PreA subunit
VRIHPSRCPDRLLDADVAERVAVTMQALASPSRVRLLACLAASPCSVGDLVTAVELEQSAVSHHLRTLRELGVVVGRRRGRRVIYALHDNHIRTLLDEAVRHVQPEAAQAAEHRPAVAETDTDTGRYLTVTYIIAEPCIDVKDKSCIDVCPVDCIHEVDRMLVIDAEECIDCGACEPECPVEAIFPEDALPDKWEPFVKINYAYPDGDAINGLVDTYATEHNVQNTPPAA